MSLSNIAKGHSNGTRCDSPSGYTVTGPSIPHPNEWGSKKKPMTKGLREGFMTASAWLTKGIGCTHEFDFRPSLDRPMFTATSPPKSTISDSYTNWDGLSSALSQSSYWRFDGHPSPESLRNGDLQSPTLYAKDPSVDEYPFSASNASPLLAPKSKRARRLVNKKFNKSSVFF